MEKFNERFSYLMDKVLKLSSNALGTSLGANISSILRYRNGQNSPNIEFVEKLCKHYGISSNWLLLGIGPVKISDLILNANNNVASEKDLPRESIQKELKEIEAAIHNLKIKYNL